MAATFSRALAFLIFLIFLLCSCSFKRSSNDANTYPEERTSSGNVIKLFGLHCNATTRIRTRLTLTSQRRVRRAIITWSSRGLTFLAIPENKVLLDITICCDVERNPGMETRKETEWTTVSYSAKSLASRRTELSRDLLLFYRKFSSKPAAETMQICKGLGVLKYRSRRGGRSRIISPFPYPNEIQSIKVVTGRRVKPQGREKPKDRCLVQVPRASAQAPTKSLLAVPKLMFINICSLGKTKNRVRASVAVEADLKSMDIDICVVSETHLKPDVPDAFVNIPNYTIHRRDRNYGGADKRNKGGVAIYTRKNLTVMDVYKSKLYELICVTLLLPSGHRMLICGLYHPPKFNYRDTELMTYLVNIFDDTLDKYPDTVFVCGGDLNQLDLDRLQSMTGWNVLVDFPTRGNSHLDNCLTNRPDLFNTCYPFTISVKTDHIGFVVPAATKLKPIRTKVTIRDCRAHRKADLYAALVKENWDRVLASSNVDQAVGLLEEKIHGNMDRCMPVRSVSFSSRDPAWMTPLLKYLISSKSRISPRNVDRLRDINKRISNLISENRRNYMTAPLGSRDWWRRADALSQRRGSSGGISLENSFLQELNDHFAQICTDENYTEPAAVVIDSDIEIPEISERQVWNSLRALKRTATGPDLIPYWVWKEHAEILTPVITKIWNLSISTRCWPSPWKCANINPLPKVDIPKAKGDYRGINITPVIARAFEKIVYRSHAQDVIEDHLCSTQYAYREGGNCTGALLALQHRINEFLDNPDCRAVRLFTMDFSKAFDSVKHELLARKLKSLQLNPYIINLYLSFLKGRKQRICYNNFSCDWKCVNQGTTQGSVSGPYLFNIFINDLEIYLDTLPVLFKYADDSNIIAPVWKDRDMSEALVTQFLDWTERNRMLCNPGKCKEITVLKKGNHELYPPIFGIPSCTNVSILGVTFQSDCKFNTHVKNKLVKANKCLYVLRSLRKEGYMQAEIDFLFDTLVLPNFTYALSVYGASESDLTPVQCFLDRCWKRNFITRKYNIRSILQKQDHSIFKRVSQDANHPLLPFIPRVKASCYNLRTRSSVRPSIKSERFKSTFVNRLIFRYNLALE